MLASFSSMEPEIRFALLFTRAILSFKFLQFSSEGIRLSRVARFVDFEHHVEGKQEFMTFKEAKLHLLVKQFAKLLFELVDAGRLDFFVLLYFLRDG